MHNRLTKKIQVLILVVNYVQYNANSNGKLIASTGGNKTAVPSPFALER